MQAVQHQAAARRQHIAQQRHLRTAQTIEHHVHAAVIGDFVDPHQQIFFLGDDHFLGTQRQQVFTFLLGLGRGDHSNTQGLAQLYERRSGAMTRVSHQSKLPGLDPCQIGIGEIGDQQRRVVHARFNRAKHIRITGDCRARQNDLLAVDRVVVRALGRKAGDLVTDLQVIDAITDSGDDTGHLLAKA
ncbi:hypothetical protein D3C78_1328320 [compost metagenome]